MATGGSGETAEAAAGGHLGRAFGAFLVCVAGLLAAASAFPESAWAWALVVAVVAGSIAGRVSLVWLVWIGVAASCALLPSATLVIFLLLFDQFAAGG